MPKIQIKLGSGYYTYECFADDVAPGDKVLIPAPFWYEDKTPFVKIVEKVGSDYEGELRTVLGHSVDIEGRKAKSVQEKEAPIQG